MYDELLATVHEAAKMLHVSDNTIWRMVADGRLPAIRIGRSVRFSREAIHRWVHDRQHEAQCGATA